MFVHSCTVDDGDGDLYTLIDFNGCSLDKHLLQVSHASLRLLFRKRVVQNLNYSVQEFALVAGQSTHVFKYADRAVLYFQCQISITVREPGEVRAIYCQRRQMFLSDMP